MKALHQPGDVVRDRYQIVQELGHGSSGTTYEAKDLTTRQSVALKVVSLLAATDWKVLELFEREAQVLANLDHPQIPNYIDYFNIDSVSDRLFYLAQELAVGPSLQTRVEQGWIATEDETKHIAAQILEVLCYLHQRVPSVIHRDIKPANLISRKDGIIMVVDFGAVRHVYRNTLTMGMTFVGTAGYMPPEQFQGRVRPASDLYSLGATLVFILSGRSPDRIPQARMRLNIKPYVDVSPPFLRWLEHLLEPALEDRIPTAAEALEQLQQVDAPKPRMPVIPDNRPSLDAPEQRSPSANNIQYERSPHRLYVRILPSRHRSGAWFSIMFWSVLGGLPLLGALTSIVGAFLAMIFSGPAGILPFFFSWLFLLNPFTLVSAAMLLILCTHETQLEIDQQTFNLQFSCAGYTYRRLMGETRRLRGVVRRNAYCTLLYGVIPYSFGGWLNPGEQDWIIYQLADFVQQANHPDATS